MSIKSSFAACLGLAVFLTAAPVLASSLNPAVPLAALAPASTPAPAYTLRVGQMGTSIKASMVVLAHQLGYYKEEGLNVSLEQIANLNDGISAITLGKLDILPMGVIPTCSFVAQGAALTVFGGTIAEGSACVSLPARAGEYATLEGFRGKKIACVRPETGHMMMKAALRKAGIPLSEVRFVELPNMQAVVEAVRKGMADVGFVNSGFELNAQIQGLAVPFPVAKYAPDAPCCRQTASRAALERDREPYVRFQVANLRAMKTMLDDPALTVQTLAAYSGQNPNYVKYCIYDSVMRISMDPRKASVLEFYQTMKDNGDIRTDTPFRMEDAVDSSIYKEALDRLLQRSPADEDLLAMRRAAE